MSPFISIYLRCYFMLFCSHWETERCATCPQVYVYMCVCVCFVIQSRLTLCDPMDCSPPGSSLCPWDSLGKNTSVDCHALLQGILPTQGSNPGLLSCRWILYHLSHQGSPRILDWAAYPFSRRSCRPRN